MKKNDISKILAKAYEYGKKYTHKGKTAQYISALAEESAERLAGVIIDPSGEVFEIGEAKYRFSMQSVVKVAIYLLVLENYEFAYIKKFVGVKPSSKPFNSILELELSNKNIPVNPFINAGAIVACYLLLNKFGDGAADVVVEKVRSLTGNSSVDYSTVIYKSEREYAFANRALTYMMLTHGIIPKEVDVDKLLDVYFKSCAIMVDTFDLARMGQVLSRGGVNLAGEKLADPAHMTILRTIMANCGTYDYSGDFAIRIGIPAKSGVGGGIMTASKAGYGIAVYSPGLDTHGNSYAGTRMLESISKDLGLSIY